MKTNRFVKHVVISISILGLLIWLSAVAKPIQKPDNPEVPVLLAEISDLNTQIEELEATIQSIEEQNADLEAQFEDLVAVIQDFENFAPLPNPGETMRWASFDNSNDFADTGQDGI